MPSSTFKIEVAVVALALACAACGKKGGASDEAPASTASATSAAAAAPAAAKKTCNSIKVNSKCAEFTTPDSITAGQVGCEFLKGTFGADPCPSDFYGACSKEGQILHYYKGKGAEVELDADMAKVDCEMVDGKYTANASAPAANAAGKSASADVSCDAVVAKLMSLQKSPAGASEKKLFQAMCQKMDAQRKACIVGSATMAELDAKCGKGKAF